MIPNLGLHEAATIDEFINKTCSRPAHFGELQQLRYLVSFRFRRGLERLLNGTLRRGRSHAVCDVRIGWIDKIPIARSKPLGRGTELGDMILFAFEERRDLGGGLLTELSRAAILQAKIATSVAQLAAPSVPIGIGSSTSNELALLSSWPPFALHQTSGSKQPRLKNVTVCPTTPPPPSHGWFIAAPGKPPTARSGWPCWWMAGQASNGVSCGTTFGELLIGFLTPSASGPRVGYPFNRQRSGTWPPPLASPPDWSDLCNEVRRILSLYAAPRALFWPDRRLFGPGPPRVYSIPTWANEFVRAPAANRSRVLDQACGWGPFVSPRLGTAPFRPSTYNVPYLPVEERAMFALAVTITRFGDGEVSGA